MFISYINGVNYIDIPKNINLNLLRNSTLLNPSQTGVLIL